jgi:hypothetical protein
LCRLQHIGSTCLQKYKKTWKIKRFVAKNFKKNPKDWILCEKLQSLLQKRKHFPPTEQKSKTVIFDLV